MGGSARTVVNNGQSCRGCLGDTWRVLHGWNSRYGEKPAGFPSRPFVLVCTAFPRKIYVSKAESTIPPEDGWYSVMLERNVVPRPEPEISCKLVPNTGMVKVIDKRRQTTWGPTDHFEATAHSTRSHRSIGVSTALHKVT